jgi:hypothetical protein
LPPIEVRGLRQSLARDIGAKLPFTPAVCGPISPDMMGFKAIMHRITSPAG